MAELSDEELAAFVEASCVRSGVPGHVNDAAVISRVAVLLLGVSCGRTAPQSDKTTGVEGEHGDGDVSLGWAV